MKRQKITLNEWFEEWFANYKIPNIKETSVFPMRSKYYNTFGKAIGNMKVTDIRNLDIQRVINDMNKQGRASSSMRDALGRVRECLESAKNNRITSIHVLKSMYLGKIKQQKDVSYQWQSKQGFCRK